MIKIIHYHFKNLSKLQLSIIQLLNIQIIMIIINIFKIHIIHQSIKL